MARRGPAIARALARVLGFGLLALLALAAGAYALVCHTATGRGWVRSLAVEQGDALLRGQLEVRELTRLGFGGLALRGVAARDPSGEQVLSIESLSVELSPLSLLAGEVVIDRIAVKNARVEFADLGDEQGAIAAFSPADASGGPASAADPDPPPIAVRSIELDGVSVTADVPDLGRAGVTGLHARGRFTLHGVARAELRALRATLVRGERAIGAVQSARGTWAAAGEPTELSLQARLAHTDIALDASGRLPGDPAFETSPVSVSLTADAIDSELLAAFGQGALADRLRAPVRAALTASGTPNALDARLDLSSRAGEVRVTAALAGRDQLALSVHSDGFTPAELWAGAPSRRVALELDSKLGVGQAPARIPFELRVPSASLDGAALPSLRASGRVEEQRVRGLDLHAEGQGVTLELRGDAGAEQLDLRGELHARSFEAAGFSAGALDATFRAEGPPARLRTAIELRGRSLGYGQNVRVTRVALDAHGGPERYVVALDLALPETALHLEGEVMRGPQAVEIDASGRGTLRRYPFSLRVQDARVGYAGTADVKLAVVQALGQRVVLRGRYGGSARDRLTANAHGDLRALSRALALEPALPGEFDLVLAARGTVEKPSGELTVTARDVGVPERPRFDAVAEAELDAGAGELRASVEAKSGRDLDLTAQLAADFEARAGRPWYEALRDGRFDVALALGATSAEWIEAWLPEPLPVRGVVTGEVRLQGKLQRPQLTARLRAQVRHPDRQRTLELALDARYADAAVEATLAAHDVRGTWLEGRFALAHPADGIEQFLAPGVAMLHEAQWQAALRIAPRPLGALPADVELASDLEAISMGVELSAEHAARAEPTAHVAIDLRRPAHAVAYADAHAQRCAEQQLDLSLRAELANGRAEVRITADSDAQRLFEAGGAAVVRLAPLLAGTGPLAASDAGLTVELAQLDVESLPLVCGVARGRLTGTVRGSGLLAADPMLHVELQGERISMGARSGIDFVLRARATEPEATLQASMQHRGTHSTLVARIPIRWKGSSVELVQDQAMSARAELDRVPIAMLLPPSFAVSQASGHLSGAVDVSGTLGAPRLRGHLEPREVALTITGIAQPLHGIEGRIAFTDRHVAIERLVARDRGGSLAVHGTAELVQDRDMVAKLVVEANEFPLRQQGQVAGELDAQMRVVAKLTDRKTRVHVQLEDASAWVRGGELRKGISLEGHPDIIDPRAQRSATPESGSPATPVEITLDADESFWVRRNDFAVKLSTRLQIQIEDDQVHVRGPLRIHRGYLQLFGETFDIDGKSKVEFAGGSPPDPVLEIVAGTVNRRTGEKIDVRITGRASAPALTFLIDEREVTAGDAALAIFGRGDGGGKNAEGQAKSFVAGMMAGVMAMSARRELGDAMPILMLEPEDDLGSTRVRAGFELDSLVPGFLENVIHGVYVEGIVAGGGGEQSTSSDMEGGVLLELYLPNDFVTSGQYGPGETWSLDLGWEP